MRKTRPWRITSTHGHDAARGSAANGSGIVVRQFVTLHAGKFMAVVLSQGSVKALLSDDHFLGRACFDEDRGQAGLSRKRSNETHASTTDSDAPLYRKRPS